EVLNQLLSNGGREVRAAAGRVMDKLAQQTAEIDKIEAQAIAGAEEGDEARVQPLVASRDRRFERRKETLCEGRPLLDWAKIRPMPKELAALYDEGTPRFEKALRAAR